MPYRAAAAGNFAKRGQRSKWQSSSHARAAQKNRHETPPALAGCFTRRPAEHHTAAKQLPACTL
jgi:hypothetical protein